MIGEVRFHHSRNAWAVGSTLKENSLNILGRGWAACATAGVGTGCVIAGAAAGCETRRITNARTIKIDTNMAAEASHIQRGARRRNCHTADLAARASRKP